MSLLLTKNNFNQLKALPLRNLQFRYEFSFVSLISPLNIFYHKNVGEPKNLTFKKSYLLATWMYYLKLTERDFEEKTIKLTILPRRIKSYALPKAPMAHKTNSHEHFKFRFFYFTLTFNTTLTSEYYLTSSNAALLFLIFSKPLFPIFDTNLLFLKSYKLIFFSSDTRFFTYRLH